jgi:O-antigen/teichoic acid export membrane protein
VWNATAIRRVVGYGARVQLGNASQLLNHRLDVLILQFFRPLREVGYYVVAQAVAEVVLTLGRAFQSALMPAVAAVDERVGLTITTRALRHHTILAASAVIACAGLAYPVVVLGYGAAFKPAITPLLILLPAMWFLGTGNVVTADLRGRGRPGLASQLSAAALILTIALDFALIPSLGMIGAALASVVAYCLFGVASVFCISRITARSPHWLCVPRSGELRVYVDLMLSPWGSRRFRPFRSTASDEVGEPREQ